MPQALPPNRCSSGTRLVKCLRHGQAGVPVLLISNVERAMNRSPVDTIVDAVLYEGYILYPYRPAVKNRQRWTFGGLYPRAYSEAQAGSDAWRMQTECLVRGNDLTDLHVKVRFLHLTARLVAELDSPRQELTDLDQIPLRFVDSLQVGGRVFQTWQEADGARGRASTVACRR